MNPLKKKPAFAVVISLMIASSAVAQSLAGSTGNGEGAGWQSSWIDLKPNTSFKTGDVIRIKVEGKAENVLVRFLPALSQPSTSDGIEGQVRKVPANRTLDVKLERDHPNVKQISVHGGPEAWGRPLGPNNGAAILTSAERVTK